MKYLFFEISSFLRRVRLDQGGLGGERKIGVHERSAEVNKALNDWTASSTDVH